MTSRWTGGSEDRSLISFNVMAVMAGGLEDGEGGTSGQDYFKLLPCNNLDNISEYGTPGQMNEN